MLKKIAEIFEKEVKKEIPEFDESQLATTSLMILTAKYDGEFDEVEKAEILKMIKDFYSFDENKIVRIFEAALSLTEKANDIHQFTSELNKSLNDDEKLSIIKMLWKMHLYSLSFVAPHKILCIFFANECALQCPIWIFDRRYQDFHPNNLKLRRIDRVLKPH